MPTQAERHTKQRLQIRLTQNYSKYNTTYCSFDLLANHLRQRYVNINSLCIVLDSKDPEG